MTNRTNYLIGPGCAGVGIGMGVRLASLKWKSQSSQRVQDLAGPLTLKHSNTAKKTNTVSFRDFGSLPPPVARYFRLVLQEGQPIIRSARIAQDGEFRVGNHWCFFKSEQCFSANPPGFLWDANILMGRLMMVRIRDAYINGRGSMQARLFGLVPIVNQCDKPELNAGALQRYLAESVWLPTALLPTDNLTWSAVGDDRALAKLTDSGTTVSLEFLFNDSGEITGIYSPGRYRETSGLYKLTPWAGQFRRYEARSGMRIPIEGAAEWRLPEGVLHYWKGRVTEIEYDVAQSEFSGRDQTHQGHAP